MFLHTEISEHLNILPEFLLLRQASLCFRQQSRNKRGNDFFPFSCFNQKFFIIRWTKKKIQPLHSICHDMMTEMWRKKKFAIRKFIRFETFSLWYIVVELLYHKTRDHAMSNDTAQHKPEIWSLRMKSFHWVELD